MTDPLYHITSETDWEARNKKIYAPDSFSYEGFIHFSTSIQLIATAIRIFKDRDPLLVLEVDPEGLEMDIVFENLEGGTELFPHLYRTLPLENIIRKFFLEKDEIGVY